MLLGTEDCAFGFHRTEIASDSIIKTEACWGGIKKKKVENNMGTVSIRNPLEAMEAFTAFFFPPSFFLDFWSLASVLEAFCRRFDPWLSALKVGEVKADERAGGPL